MRGATSTIRDAPAPGAFTVSRKAPDVGPRRLASKQPLQKLGRFHELACAGEAGCL